MIQLEPGLHHCAKHLLGKVLLTIGMVVSNKIETTIFYSLQTNQPTFCESNTTIMIDFVSNNYIHNT